MSWIEAPALCESSRSQQLPAVSTGAPVLDSTEGPHSPPCAVRRGPPRPERESKGGLRLRREHGPSLRASPEQGAKRRVEAGTDIWTKDSGAL